MMNYYRKLLYKEMSPGARGKWLFVRVSFWIGCISVLIGTVLGVFATGQLWPVAFIGLGICIFTIWVEQDLMFETEQRLENRSEAD